MMASKDHWFQAQFRNYSYNIYILPEHAILIVSQQLLVLIFASQTMLVLQFDNSLLLSLACVFTTLCQ